MSIEYMGIANGWKLSQEEVNLLPEELCEDLDNKGYLICLNFYEDEPNYLLLCNRSYYTVDEGNARSISSFNFSVVNSHEHLFARYLPDRAQEPPQIYLFSQVS